MWFKYGLKAQKFLALGKGRKQHALKGQKLLAQGNGHKQHALKGQKLLAQGSALGFGAVTCRPVRAKALKLLAIFKAFALTGRLADWHYTQGAALG